MFKKSTFFLSERVYPKLGIICVVLFLDWFVFIEKTTWWGTTIWTKLKDHLKIHNKDPTIQWVIAKLLICIKGNWSYLGPGIPIFWAASLALSRPRPSRISMGIWKSCKSIAVLFRSGVAQPLPGGKKVPAKTFLSALWNFLKI